MTTIGRTKISTIAARLAAYRDMREYYHKDGRCLIYCYNPERIKAVFADANEIAKSYKKFKIH